MRTIQFFTLIAVCAVFCGACDTNKKKLAETPDISVFPRGELLTGNTHFSGDAWLRYLVEKSDSLDCTVGNVTFAPGCHNNWHSHPGGQILLCTAGEGYYQEKGKPVQLLKPGDVVKILPDVIHWHGATPDNEFVHLAIGTQVDKGGVIWLEAVTDEEYNSFNK